MTDTPHSTVRLLEELSLNAWPSLQTMLDDGWVLRFADGYTSRANSVQVLYPSTDDVEGKINRCEKIYTAQGLQTVFKITPAAIPADLDERLARRGYQQAKPTATQVTTLESLPPPTTDDVHLSPTLDDAWLEAFCRLRNVDMDTLPTMRHMINSIIPEKQFATLYRDGVPVAQGFGVLDRGYVGLYDIVTDERLRNQGLAREVVLHLLNWAKESGASHAYLQVMKDNAPALHLYGKLGFQEVYTYWYRYKTVQQE
jgi:ribosomal protein S18 acetylase RimI-like enzyme